MTVSFDPGSRALPMRHIIGRGLAAAHGALLGVLYLFVLQAPLQVLGAESQVFQGKAMHVQGQQVDPGQVVLAVVWGLGAFALALAVFFLFPLVQGGILGQVRDRLESPSQPPGPFGRYARAYYLRLLGSQGLFLLAGLAIVVPVMVLSMSLAFQELAKAVPAGPDEVIPSPQEFQRQFLSHGGILSMIVINSLLMSAVAMVYWVANSIVVVEEGRVVASWRKALHFCRENLSAVLVVWLLAVAVGLVMLPLSMAGQLGLVNDPWILIGLAVVYAALLGYWGVLMAGLSVSLYLGRGAPSEQPDTVLSPRA
jgi:hypothetical protein